MDEVAINWLKPSVNSLHTAVFGQSGSGKTFLIKNSVYSAVKDLDNFPSYHRFVVIDPKRQKGDFDILSVPITGDNIDEIAESINENRVTVIWPDYRYISDVIDDTIEILFQLSDIYSADNRAFSATLIIDEAGEVISHQKIPDSIGKMAVQGRAKMLKLVVLNQRPILNRKLDAQLENVILFYQMGIDSDNLSKRWGINIDKWINKLETIQYSFVAYNHLKRTEKLYGPLKIT